MDETDLELLERYLRAGAQDAFTTLVQRHLPLVYSAALRQLRSSLLAEDAAQSVFVELAKSARTIAPGTVLPAWLYQVTRHKVIDVIRREQRRQTREEAFHNMNITSSDDCTWAEIEPHLDAAIRTLDSTDQAAILLRFFQAKSLAEVARELGISENAAQKRVTRAVATLRKHFSAQGIHLSAVALVALVTANAVQAAPASLLASVAAVAMQGFNPLVASSISTLKPIFMTATHKIVTTVALVATTGFGLYQTSRNSHLLRENQRLQNETLHASSVHENVATGQNDRVAQLLAENAQLKSNTAELMTLRAEVTRLRNDNRAAAAVQSANTSLLTSAQSWAARVADLKKKLNITPGANVPELALLNEEDWLGAVKGNSLETDKDYRRALANLRNTAQNKCAILLQPALAEYLKENNNQFPTDVLQLQAYLKEPVAPEILQRFAVLPSREVENVQMGGDWVISLKTAVDPEFDQRYGIGPNGFGGSTWENHNPIPFDVIQTLKPVYESFNTATGHAPADLAELEPYLKTSEQKTAYAKIHEIQLKNVKQSP